MFDFSQLNSVLGGFNGTPENGLLALTQMNGGMANQPMASPFANMQGFQGLLQPYQPYGQTQSPYTQMNPFLGLLIQDYLTPFQEQRQTAQENPNQTISTAVAPPVAPQPVQQPIQSGFIRAISERLKKTEMMQNAGTFGRGT